jgi:branched-chain amino acid transport system permease protein
VAFDIAIYMLLALGLNVVVGWGGLLDLGYIAFFESCLRLRSSFGSPWRPPAGFVAIPLVVVIVAPFPVDASFSGDYLAIVTLFFLQLFSP